PLPYDTEKRAGSRNPFRQLCDLALKIVEEEQERDRTPPHQRHNRTVEERVGVEELLRNLKGDCSVAGKALQREREAELAAGQLSRPRQSRPYQRSPRSLCESCHA